jgi:hypothetical protein
MVQLFPHAVGQASGAAPANYLPEGTMAAALRLIAQQKADAIFSSIFDDHPNMGKVIDFVSVRFRYAGAVKQGDTSLDAVLVSAIGTKTTYWLNSQGEVVRSEDDEGVIWTAVTEKQVGEQFPEAPLQIWQLSESVLPQVQGFWKRLLGISL